MGVHGLMSYILDHGSALQSHKLRDTRVVIDGNNLLHLLYHHSRIPWLFAGEYDSYAASVARFFDSLQLCKIDPFVVFDGCYDLAGSKLATVRSRARDRIVTCSLINRGLTSRAGKLLPLLTGEVLVAELDRLGVRHVTCCLEADNEAAALAIHWACPVMSNDSDFYIFPLQAGFLPMDRVSFHPVQEDCSCCLDSFHYYLACSIFRIESIRLPGVPRICPRMMPLFATLMGNDFVKKKTFETFLASLPTSSVSKRQASNRRKSAKKSTSISRRKITIVSLLTWLERFETVDEAVNQVVDKFKEEAREGIHKCILGCLAQYSWKDAWILRYIADPEATVMDEPDFLPHLPYHVKVTFHRRKISLLLANALYSGQVFLPCVVENIDLPSVFDAFLPIRCPLYGLLSPEMVEESTGRKAAVVEISRVGKRTLKTAVNLDVTLSLTSTLLSPACSTESARLDLFRAQLGLPRWDLIGHCETGPLASYVSVMYLWLSLTRHGLPSVSGPECLAALTSCLYLLDQFDAQLMAGDLGEMRTHRRNRMAKYLNPQQHRAPLVNRTHPLNLSALHCYNQLQCCYLLFSQWNTVLAEPYSLPPPQAWFCGRLYYNLVADLVRRRQPELFLVELMGRQSLAACFLEHVIAQLGSGGGGPRWSGAAPIASLLDCETVDDENNEVDEDSAVLVTSSDETEEEDAADTIDAQVDPNNRFSVLASVTA